MNKHNLNCTCPNCSGTGMSVHKQTEFCAGTGQRKISAPDDLETCARIASIERMQLMRFNMRYAQFGNYPNK